MTARALASGALQPIETEAVQIDDAGVRFLVRVVSSIERKQAAHVAQRADPLGDYEPDLFVGELSPTHYALLNKYNVVPQHMLIVTRRFAPQEEPLTAEDFDALARCIAEFGDLGFYNSGREAGASQARKHLQLVPMPEIPIEPLLLGGARLPFQHAFAQLSSLSGMHGVYRQLLRWQGPYNLLVSRSWMFAVPRSRECFESISVNALGFAGALFARRREELERIREVGPMRVLRHVART